MEARNVYVCTAEKLTRNHTGDGRITQVKVAGRGALFVSFRNIQISMERRAKKIIRSGEF